MLATLTHDHFSDPDWIYERKLDGQRCMVFHNGDRVDILSRNRRPLNVTYPELVDAVCRLPPRCVADGEIVAFDGRTTSFRRLQKRIGVTDARKARRIGVKVYLYLFDLLFLDGWKVSRLPLRRRKSILKAALPFDDPLRYTPHRNARGEAYYDEACRKGWEGIIAKEADSPYVHGRSRKWLKFKCSEGQELIVCGFTDPKGSRRGFGALLLGYYEEGALRYAGKVGTGFDENLLESLRDKLDDLQIDEQPFAVDKVPNRAVHWVEPVLVAEIGFTEWTSDGRLRHPRYIGLREDKATRDVVREAKH